MAKKERYVYHLMIVHENKDIQKIQVLCNRFLSKPEEVSKAMGTFLCRIRGRRAMIREMDRQLILTEESTACRYTYIILKYSPDSFENLLLDIKSL
jgi:hypothetical protein